MFKIVALNDKEDDEDGLSEPEENSATREAQETIAETEYIRAIKFKSEGEIDLCLHLLMELLQTQVLNENIQNNRNEKLSTIKYNCHKNIALILEERFDYMLALQHYISAILIDNTDVSTLNRFGQLALKLNITDLAEYAFESCLYRNPMHWAAAEGLLQIMNKNFNIIGSYCCAAKLLQEADNNENASATLQEINYLFRKNVFFLNKCSGFEKSFLEIQFKKQNLLRNLLDDKLTFKKTEEYEKPDLKPFRIKQPNWRTIGEFIVRLYYHLNEINHNMLFTFNFEEILLNTDELGIDPTTISTSTKSDDQFIDNYFNSDSDTKSESSKINKLKPRRSFHRYSLRKSSGRDEILAKYPQIPFEGLWPFWDLSEDDDNINNECAKCKVVDSEDSFNLETRKEFEEFVGKIKTRSVDLMELTYKWLKYISLACSLPIPDGIKLLYSDIFKIYISHFDFSTWNQLTPTNYLASFRICLLYLELQAECHLNDRSDLWSRVFHQVLCNISNCHIISSKNIEIYNLKLLYLENLIHFNERRAKEFISCLQQIHEIFKRKNHNFVLHLPNLGKVCLDINFIQKFYLKYQRHSDVDIMS